MTGITKKENLSGKKWWSIKRNKAEYANSTSIDKLDATFRENIKEFKKAITDAFRLIASCYSRLKVPLYVVQMRVLG